MTKSFDVQLIRSLLYSGGKIRFFQDFKQLISELFSGKTSISNS